VSHPSIPLAELARRKGLIWELKKSLNDKFNP
jgi:hypothetical protein